MDKRWLIVILVIFFFIGIFSLFMTTDTAEASEVSAQVVNTATRIALVIPTTGSTTTPREIKLTPTIEAYSGNLSQQQKDELATISLEYLALDNAEAKKMARSIGLEGPSMMCGPLAATMLWRVGVLDTEVDPYDFYYLNPRPGKDLWRLEKMMPKDEFEYFEFDQMVSYFDFSKFPLYPGDFLYLYAGEYGSFEHMLAVTRVDELGKAYSVTNVFEMIDGEFTKGFVIKEVMLYDPNTSGVGQFADYNSSEYAYVGRTGYKFLVIRKK